ncbi:hypothetical protein FRC02_012153 [Tulasnella sp. 418]|nr:hypothetical protein FRC02_012153 [Tulasnella sp. 418]
MLRRTSSSSAAMLSDEQKRMYRSEKEENFRWILKIAATRSPYRLSEKDLASIDLQNRLSDIGQFTELAHGSMNPTHIWEFLTRLSEPGFPLHGYTYLEGSQLIEVFRGKISDLQGYVAYRPQSKQLMIVFSGTSTPAQAIQDVKAWNVAYPGPGDDVRGTRVHAGFYSLYQGVRDAALDAMKKGLESCDVSELVITGHSMGSVMCYLLLLELIEPSTTEQYITPGIQIKLAVFGSPRAGNPILARCWRNRVKQHKEKYGDDSLMEWSVKGYNDGVPALPSTMMGYMHFTESPLYLHHGRLYHIPSSESEHSIFTVTPPTPSTPISSSAPPDTREDSLPTSPEHPLGGHNYYGGRDMEKLQRLMRWAAEVGLGKEASDWEQAFLQKVKEDDEKWTSRAKSPRRWWNMRTRTMAEDA